MKLRYFAWVRERIGKTEEEISLPPEVETTTDLLAWLKTRGEEYEWALEKADVIRVAVDQVHAAPGASIVAAKEVALFPPMTGG